MITVATRKSALALAQTRAFIQRLSELHPSETFEELHIVTEGDRQQSRPLYELGGKGLFVREIEEALLDSRADIAVHSMKDLPAEQPDGLFLACIPEREVPFDVLLIHESHVKNGQSVSLDNLPQGARVGSSSQRRKIALLRNRPDLVVEPLRGNVDTRLRKLREHAFDAIVLAAAGLRRLRIELADLPPHVLLHEDKMLPAVAQGTLAIESRCGDSRVEAILAPLDHLESRLRAKAERGVLKALGADCTVPLAAFATLSQTVQGFSLNLRAWLSDSSGQKFVAHATETIVQNEDEAELAGKHLGAILLEKHRQ